MHKRNKKQLSLSDVQVMMAAGKLCAAAATGAEEARPSSNSSSKAACSPLCITLGPEPTQCS